MESSDTSMLSTVNYRGGGKRNPSLDYLKTIAISLVIIYHSEVVCDCISVSFLSMCVPIFFSVNGCLMLRKEYSYIYLLRKNLKIFILVLLWGMLYSYVGCMCVDGSVGGIQDVFRQIGQHWKGDHLWYLEVLFMLNIFNPLIYAYISQGNGLRQIVLFFVFLFFTINIIIFRIPFNLRPFSIWGSWALIYYLLGIMATNRKWAEGKRSIFVILFLGFIIAQCFCNYLAENKFFMIEDYVTRNYQSPFIIGAVACLLVIASTIQIPENKFVAYIGKHTLGVYLLQGIVIRVLFDVFHNNGILLCTLPIITLSLCLLIVYVLENNKVGRYLISLDTLTTSKYDKV